eukprot:29946-Pelagomonas_calceolata.AAC.2
MAMDNTTGDEEKQQAMKENIGEEEKQEMEEQASTRRAHERERRKERERDSEDRARERSHQKDMVQGGVDHEWAYTAAFLPCLLWLRGVVHCFNSTMLQPLLSLPAVT